MSQHAVAKTEDIPEGERIVVQVKGREIGIFNIDGDYHAYTNWCAHQGGPCCEGSLTGTMYGEFDRETLEVSLEWSEEDNILNCPWHGWEYEITSGDCLSRQNVRLPSHDVEVEGEDVMITL